MVTSGAFHSETPLPASLRRPPRTPSTMLRLNPRTRRGRGRNSEQVSFEAIVFDQRAFRGPSRRKFPNPSFADRGRIPDGHATDRKRRRIHRDNVAGAVADEHRTRPPGQHDAVIDPDRALYSPGTSSMRSPSAPGPA